MGYSPIKMVILGQKLKMQKGAKNDCITTSSSVQDTARKNTKLSRNETILKIGHHAKAIAFESSSLLVKN